MSGQYASNWVKGFQTAKEALYPLQAAACCKHFVANELDGWNGTDRNHIDCGSLNTARLGRPTRLWTPNSS